MDKAVRDAWGAWLGSQPWDWFLTITFKQPVPGHRQESVCHAAGQFLKKRWEPARLFLAVEHHLSQSIHLHGLYLSSREPFVKPNERTDIWRDLVDMFGRSQVAVPRGKDAVTKYVSKYCVKASGYYEMW